MTLHTLNRKARIRRGRDNRVRSSSGPLGRRRRGRRLAHEPLEHRYMLSTVTATSAAEDVGADVDPMLPDLLGVYFDAQEPIDWGQNFRINAQIRNLGDCTAGSSTAEFYLSPNSTISKSDVLLGWTRVGSVPSGQYRSVDKQYLLPYTPPPGFTKTDTVYIGMIVDADDEVKEMAEWNNRNRGDGLDRDKVAIKPLPDLAGRYFNSQEPLEWGQRFDVQASIKNQGSARAGAAMHASAAKRYARLRDGARARIVELRDAVLNARDNRSQELHSPRNWRSNVPWAATG